MSKQSNGMMASVFVGISVDGFMARRNGDIDFLPGDSAEPHGFEEFITTIDAHVIGRNTFEWCLKWMRQHPESGWPYGKKPVIVLSSRALDLSEIRGGNVEHMSGEPQEIVAKLSGRGWKHLYVDGGVTIQRFLRAGLIQKMIITRVPVLIGEGLPLFGSLPHDVRLTHLATKHFSSGLVTTEYRIAGSDE